MKEFLLDLLTRLVLAGRQPRALPHYAAMVEKVPANAIVFRAPGAKVMHRNEDV